MTLKQKIEKLKEMVARYENMQDGHEKAVLLGQILGFISAL